MSDTASSVDCADSADTASSANAADTAARAVAPFRFILRVYWEDTDAGGVVFYANYLKFFERARTEWLRSMGHEQEKLRSESGVVFIVAETQVRYRRPARLDDELAVTVEVVHAGRAQMTMAQQAWRMRAHGKELGQRHGQQHGSEHDERNGEELVAEGTIRVACVSAGTFRPRPIPTAIADALPLWSPRSPVPAFATLVRSSARPLARPLAETVSQPIARPVTQPIIQPMTQPLASGLAG